MKKLILLLCLCGSAHADELLVYNLAFGLLLAADRVQTEKIVNSNSLHEMNPVLGRSPSIRKQNLYFASAMLIYNRLSYALPKRHRVNFARIGLMVQFQGVATNLTASVNFKI